MSFRLQSWIQREENSVANFSTRTNFIIKAKKGSQSIFLNFWIVSKNFHKNGRFRKVLHKLLYLTLFWVKSTFSKYYKSLCPTAGYWFPLNYSVATKTLKTDTFQRHINLSCNVDHQKIYTYHFKKS